jgi:RNA 2',3'-cyclic 3'-phosphodiesterase
MKPNWFVALPVPADTWFARVCAPPPGVRLFHPDDLHLTVAFLGAVDEAAALSAFACAAVIPLTRTMVTLGKVVPMGNPRRPSALSAKLRQGEATVARAIGAVRDASCDAAGVHRDERPVVPHLTVARPKRSASAEERASAIRWASSLELGDAPVGISQIALYTWATERSARLFRIVTAQPLA